MLVNDCSYGGYLLYWLGPEHKVFVDSRQDRFIDGALEDTSRAYKCRPLAFWQPVFRKYAVNLVVIAPDVPLAAAPVRAKGLGSCVFRQQKYRICTGYP